MGRFSKILGMILSFTVLACCFAGCAEPKPAGESEEKPRKNPGKPLAALDTELEKQVTPFWLLDSMYRETVCFLEREDGSVTAKLLYVPDSVESLLGWDGKTAYAEGTDYTVDKDSRTLIRTADSRIPYFTPNDLAGKDENGDPVPEYPGQDSLGRMRFGDHLYCVTEPVYGKQLMITYSYKEEPGFTDPAADSRELLGKTVEKMKNGETLNVVFFGDSIVQGCDASSHYMREPFQDDFSMLFRRFLEQTYGCRIKRYNVSEGGKDSAWGAENIKRVLAKKPDLVLLGFGMNDNYPGDRSAANLAAMKEAVLAEFPDCEFLIFTPTVPNAGAGFLLHQAETPEAFRTLESEGTAVLDMYSFHQKLLERKDFIECSGNNINHPNDWLIRCYAMNLLSYFYDFGGNP